MPAPSATNAGPFSTLLLSPRFDIDPAAVERAFLRAIAQIHPDHAPDNPEDDAAVAALTSAREQLLDPQKRAAALLMLLGGSLPDKSLPEGFLLEMLEARQRIEEELAADPTAARANWTQWAMTQRANYMRELTQLFARATRDDAPTLGAIRCQMNAWRYIERLIEQLDQSFDRSREET